MTIFCKIFAAHLLRFSWLINFSWRDLTRFGLSGEKKHGGTYKFVAICNEGRGFVFVTSAGVYNIGLDSLARLLEGASAEIEHAPDVKAKQRFARKIFRILVAAAEIEVRPDLYEFPVSRRFTVIDQFSAVVLLALRDPSFFAVVVNERKRTFSVSPRAESELFSVSSEGGQRYQVVPLCLSKNGNDVETAHYRQGVSNNLKPIDFAFQTERSWNQHLSIFRHKSSPSHSNLADKLRMEAKFNTYWHTIHTADRQPTPHSDSDEEIAKELTRCPPTPYGEEAR